MLNDHLSILDSTEATSKFPNYGDEDPEDGAESESFYNTKSSMNTSGIRIKVRKGSIDPNSKKKRQWVSKKSNITSAAKAVSYGAGYTTKPNEDIKLDPDTLRAGSPLNFDK